MRTLASFVLSYDGVLAGVAVIALWLYLRPTSRAARRTLLAFAIFYSLLATYGIGEVGARLLVRGFHPLERADVPSTGTTAIVVLGSGSFTVRDWKDREFSNVDFAAAARTLEAARVYQTVGPAWVISSGGHVVPDDPNEMTAVTMREALERLGVPADRILMETQSRNTYEEAVAMKPMLASIGATQVVLVTSDIHMRRSMAVFRGQGIEVIPAIARQPFLRVLPLQWVLPSELGMWRGATVAHELLGLAYYTVRGYF